MAAEGAVDSKRMSRVRWHIWVTSAKVLEWAGGGAQGRRRGPHRERSFKNGQNWLIHCMSGVKTRITPKC